MPVVRLAQAVNRKTDLIRAFTYNPQAKFSSPLKVTVKFRAAKEMDAEVDQKRTRILSRPKTVTLDDVQQQNKELAEFFEAILAANVVKIESEDLVIDPETGKPKEPSERSPVTFRHLKGLLALSPDQVAQAGGLEAPVPLDPTTNDKETSEAARANILALVHESFDFRRWIEGLCGDVSYFQDSDFDDQIKNSVAGKAS